MTVDLRDLVKQGCAREARMGFRVVGGDNTAEALASVTKKQLRRHGSISVTHDSIEHRNLLAVHHINKKTRFAHCLDSLEKIQGTVYVKLAARQQSLGSSAVETLKKNMLQLAVAAGCWR